MPDYYHDIADSALLLDSCSSFKPKLLHGNLPVPPANSIPLLTPVSTSSLLPPLDMGGMFPGILSNDYHEHDITNNAEGAIIGTTLDVMVKKITPHNVLIEPVFHQIFMI